MASHKPTLNRRTSQNERQQRAPQPDPLDLPLLETIAAFLVDRQAGGAAAGTLQFYRQKLNLLQKFCRENKICIMGDLTAHELRRFQLWLIERGNNAGGQHAVYRTIRAWLNWFELEYMPNDWHNPIKKIKAPRVPLELKDPVSLDDIQTLVATCDPKTMIGRRDKALLLFLLDTGVRAGECVAINSKDINLLANRVQIVRGKGGKGRVVFIGKKSRRAIRAYLSLRPDAIPLWVSTEGDRLAYEGLRMMIRRRAKLAGISAPTLHSFRRAFAVSCLKRGMDIRTLQELMGHSSLAILVRYTKLDKDNLATAYRQMSPVDWNNW